MSEQMGALERQSSLPPPTVVAKTTGVGVKSRKLRRTRRGDKLGSPVSQRLAMLRKAAGYESAMEAAQRLGVNVTTYQHHERGRRQVTQAAAELYARHFNVSAGYILFGEQLQPNAIVTIVGTIGAGGKVSQLQERESMAIPLGMESPAVVGLRVQGDDLWPYYQDGDVVFFNGEELAQPIDKRLVDGRECVVILVDNTMVIRTVVYNRGRAVLFAPHQPPGPAVVVRNAAPVRWVRRNVG